MYICCDTYQRRIPPPTARDFARGCYQETAWRHHQQEAQNDGSQRHAYAHIGSSSPLPLAHRHSQTNPGHHH